MPLVRYEVRNEYSLAKAELYRSAGKDEPDVVLEGVAMAGLVGIVRQLGDLAQFAAEIFHDLNEEIMVTAARGHEIMIRVQQLEAEIPSIEKALMAGTNRLHFGHTISGNWHASIRNDQNHLTQSDLPHFIRKFYEECRGPPRFFVLDKFDVAGAGACLKRYTDPSFFKMEWASSELRKPENAQRERNTARLKKRGRRQRNSEITEVPVTSQQNSRLHYSALDLSGPMCAPGNLLYTANQVLELKQWKKVPSAGLVQEDQAKDDLDMGQVTGFQSVKISGKDIEARKMYLDIMLKEEKFIHVNGERKRQVEDDLGSFDDVGGQAENFVDVLTTMETEIETDSECQIKWEVDSDIISEHRETGSQAHTKSHEQPEGYSVFLDVQSFYNAKSTGGVSDIKSSTASGKGSTADLDGGNHSTMVANCLSSKCGNIVWTKDASEVEVVHGHNNVTLFASAPDAMPAISSNFVLKPDAVLNCSSSFSFSNSELSSSFGCVHASGKGSTADLDGGNHSTMVANCLSPKCGTIVWTKDASEVEVVHDHNNVTLFASASDAMPAISNNFVPKPDAVLNCSSSFSFSNSELSSSFGCVHASTDCREKESTADLDVSYNCDIVQTTYASTKAVLDDHRDVKPFATTACDVTITSTSFVQKSDALLDRSSSFAFSNIESPDVSLNATPYARFDTEDAFFRFVTPELSVMYSDVNFASSILSEEPFTVLESSAGLTDVKFQICSSNIEKHNDSELSFISGYTNRMKSVSVSEASKYKSSEELESDLVPLITPDADEVELEFISDVSELASGLHNVQIEHSYVELEVDYAKNEILGDCISCQKTFSEHENSSTTLVGCISAQSEIEETCMESITGSLHGKHSTELCVDMFLDSMNSKAPESSMDVESVGNRVLDVSSSNSALQMKFVQMDEVSSDTSVIISTTSNHREFEFFPELQSFQVPVNYLSVSLPKYKIFSGDMLGDELICRFDNSKVVGSVLDNNLNPDILTKDIPFMIQAELARVGHINPASGSSSSTSDCGGKSINEFKKDETEAFVTAESLDVSRYTMTPVSFFHSRSLVESAHTGSHNFATTEIKRRPLAEVHTGRLHAMPTASSADHFLLDDLPHNELVTKHSGAAFQSHRAGERHRAYAKEGSVSSLSHVDAQGHDLSSSPQDQINSFYSQHAIRSPLYTSFARSDCYPEIMSTERSSSDIKTANLSPFCLFPKPVIPLQKELEEKGITDCTSPASKIFEKSFETIIDEMQSLNLLYTADGSEGGHQRGHVEHSSVSYSDHSMEAAAESAVFPEISMSTDEKLGSSRILLISSLTNSMSPSTPRDSTLMKLDDGSIETAHNINSIQTSPRRWTSTGLSLSTSQGNNSHDTVFSTSQYESVGSEDLVLGSLITEPKTKGSISQETPPPPPLPPLDWWITRPHKKSLTSNKSAAPPAPPPFPSEHSRPAKSSESQKTYIERNDSLIKAIALHDKTTLRKVIQQTQSLKAKSITEREELLKQIRTRPFSLRQTVVKKHEIPRPATNANVTAILKKASAIRQAIGSEDDEDDDWSDA